MTMNGTWYKGPRSRMQWNTKVLLTWHYKLDTWHVNKDPKQKWHKPTSDLQGQSNGLDQKYENEKDIMIWIIKI